MSKSLLSFSIKDILILKSHRPLGCTAPVVIVLGAAAVLMEGAVADAIEIWVDPNIYRSGFKIASEVCALKPVNH